MFSRYVKTTHVADISLNHWSCESLMQGKRFYCCIESLTLWQIALLPEML